jgi:hypothetical protein
MADNWKKKKILNTWSLHWNQYGQCIGLLFSDSTIDDPVGTPFKSSLSRSVETCHLRYSLSSLLTGWWMYLLYWSWGSNILPYIQNLGIMLVDASQLVDEMLLRLSLLSNLKTLRLSHIMASLTPDAKNRLAIMLHKNSYLYIFLTLRYATVFRFILHPFCLINCDNWNSLIRWSSGWFYCVRPLSGGYCIQL